MAKQKATAEEPLEKQLWKAADKLRKNIDAAEYKHIVLGLIFLKYISDAFEELYARLKADEANGADPEDKDEYKAENVFFVPQDARWTYLQSKAKQPEIGKFVDDAMDAIEKENASLKGVLPKVFARQNLDPTSLGELIDLVGNIALGDAKARSADVLGHVFEYFLGEFALAEGKKGGQFYTPRSVVELLVEMLEPYKGRVFDPCCGSGGMFVHSEKFVTEHQGKVNDISIYGQESNQTTWRLAKMNLAIRGIDSSQVKWNNEGSFLNDAHKDLKADFVMANPPFNQKDWRAANELLDDPRWRGFDVPPKSNANYGWILNMVSKLSENGIAGFILANGALSGNGEEYKIRRKLIENNLVEAIVIIPRNTFYTTDISVTLWIVNKNKKARTVEVNGKMKNYRNREKEILFMDLRRWGQEFEKMFIELSDEDIVKIAENYHNWQQIDWQNTYKNIPEFCCSANFEQIKANDFSLVPSKYIEFVDRDSGIDFDSEMKRIQKDFKELLKDEKASQEQLINAFKVLGYEL